MKKRKTIQSDEITRFIKLCQKAGVKCTQQRLKIYSEIIGRPDHPDAEAVFKKVRNQLTNISLDTVYRTLWLFQDLDLITTIGPSRERTRFEPNLKPHHHFICIKCGLISDFESDIIDTKYFHESIKKIGKAEGLQVNIQGVCLKCENNQKRKKTYERI